MDLSFLIESNRLLIRLLSVAIRGEAFFDADFDYRRVDWQEVFYEADKHQILPLLYPVIKDNGRKLHIPDELLKKFTQCALADAAVQERNYAAIGSVLRRLSDSGIPVIVLKGLVYRDLYPYPYFRTMGDYDLLIKPDHMDIAARILYEAGYYFYADDEKEASYHHDSLSKIDLHRQLISTRKFENIDSFNHSAWIHAEPIAVSGAHVLSLSPGDNAIYLLFHTATHIISGGFGLRQLCDFTLFVEYYRNEIDWDKFFRTAAMLSIDVFAKVLMEVCNILLELEIPKASLLVRQKQQNYQTHKAQDTQGENYVFQERQEDEALIRSVIEDIFDAGVFGFSSNERITSSRLLYYSSGQEVGTLWGKAFMYIKLLMPSPGKLDVRYQYAKKCPLLLPVAWIHRIIYCIFRRDIGFLEKTAILVSHKPVAMYDSRVKMLRELGLHD